MSELQAPVVTGPRGRAGKPSLHRLADGWLDRLVRRHMASAPLRFLLRDGTDFTVHPGPHAATVLLKNRRTFIEMLRNPEIGFGEAYTRGDIDVEGDLVAAVAAGYLGIRHREARDEADEGHSLRSSRHNVHRHYDIGNTFYRLWLDEQLVYTCAYFPTPEASLEDAQVAKLDYVCRKLRLRPGEKVVEAGCGWGALALHMARHYDVTVRAYNISREQIRYARERAQREGLGSRVEFVEEDYRGIRGNYDVFVSVGMLEHVGLGNYAALGGVIHRALDPAHGRGLLHFIGRDRPRPLNGWIRRRIFPGAYPPTLPQAVEGVLQPMGFTVLDVENLRLHYAKTLDHWLRRFEKAVDQVRALFDEAFVRAWRLYLAGSQAAFEVGTLQLFQVTFARSEHNDVPWTRTGLYGAP